MSQASNGLDAVIAAELLKLRTLPAVPATIAATLTVTTGIAAIFAANPDAAQTSSGVPTPIQLTLLAIPYTQVGFVLMGVLAIAPEYAGKQIRSTLTSIPSRLLVLVGKALAYLVAATSSALLVIGTAVTTAHLAATGNVPLRDLAAGSSVRPLIGAAAYLVLIGLLALAIATITRNLTTALVTMLGLLLVVSPLLNMITEEAKYLPSIAGAQLYDLGPLASSNLAPLAGGAVMLGWIAATCFASAVTFQRRDA